MPPWWVYQKTGAERPAAGRSCCFGFCGCCARPWQSRFTAATALKLTLSGACCVLRDGVEPNSFAVKLRFHRLPVYPAGVRGADLSFRGADVGLLSLDGIKLVVTRLASPARIRLLRLVPGRHLRELEYLSPVIMSRGFRTSGARYFRIFQQDPRHHWLPPL